MVTLIRGAHVLTLDPQQPILPNGAVLVDGETIVAVDSYDALRQAEGITAEFGTASTWVLPGFVNAHYHNWRTFSMGATLDAPLELFLLHMSGLELPDGELGHEFIYLNTLVSACQLIHSGITTTVDVALTQNHQPILQAYLDLGLDLIYAPSTCTRFGYVYAPDDEFLATLPPDLATRIYGQGLGLTGGYESSESYWQHWLEIKAEFGDRIQFVIAPDGPQWVSEAELRLWGDRAADQNACIHLHNSESPMEMQWALQTRQQTLTEYLAEVGLLRPNVSCAHGVWYSDRDMALLADHGVSTIHCPSSNLRLSNGIAPVADYLQAGLNVGLGTDGHGLADDSDFLTEMRLAAFLQRTPGFQTRGLTPWTVFEMATVNGARAFGRTQTGRLQPGAPANLMVLNADQMRSPYLWTGHDPYAAVLQRAKPQHIEMVMSRGKIVMQNGAIVTVDEQQVIRKLQGIYDHIWASQTGEKRALLNELEPYVVSFFEPWTTLPVSPRYQYNRR